MGSAGQEDGDPLGGHRVGRPQLLGEQADPQLLEHPARRREPGVPSLTGDRVINLVDLNGDVVGTVPIADGRQRLRDAIVSP